MLTAQRALGAIVLVKAVDLAERGATDLPGALWLLALLVWVVGGLALLAAPGRLPWALVAASGAALALDSPVDLRRQHLVLLIGLAVAAAVAADDRERLLLWRTQLTALYGFAVLAKLNESFLAGNVLARDVVDAPLWSGLLPTPGPWVLVAASAALVLAELSLGVALWVPRLHRAGLVLAVLLHGGALLLVPTSALVALRLVVFGGAAVVAYAACTRPAAPASVRA